MTGRRAAREAFGWAALHLRYATEIRVRRDDGRTIHLSDPDLDREARIVYGYDVQDLVAVPLDAIAELRVCAHRVDEAIRRRSEALARDGVADPIYAYRERSWTGQWSRALRSEDR